MIDIEKTVEETVCTENERCNHHQKKSGLCNDPISCANIAESEHLKDHHQDSNMEESNGCAMNARIDPARCVNKIDIVSIYKMLNDHIK